MASRGDTAYARRAAVGAVAGIVAAVGMAMFAMIAAATYQSTGFFTPTYHIASPVVGTDAMETSLREAAAGSMFWFSAGPALTGVLIHMMVGAFWGAVFFLAFAPVRAAGRAAAVVAGIVYGLAVMLFMSFVVLPLTAETIGGGRAISDMPELVGWWTFAAEHAMYGLVLGAWLAAMRQATAVAPVAESEQGHDRRLAS